MSVDKLNSISSHPCNLPYLRSHSAQATLLGYHVDVNGRAGIFSKHLGEHVKSPLLLLQMNLSRSWVRGSNHGAHLKFKSHQQQAFHIPRPSSSSLLNHVRRTKALKIFEENLGFVDGRRRGTRRGHVRVTALPPLMWMDIPEAGAARDFLFAAFGAGASLIVSSLAAWAWHREESRLRAVASERGRAALPEPSSTSSQKESVEWVNMVVQKIWRVYRKSLEMWLMGLLQPAIDKLPKPEYVERVEIAEFSLNFEPISLRNVQRRASRRSNDLQYHIGLRYTGGARCLLVLHLRRNGIRTAIPVGVHDLDVDGELWVKLRLTPRKPYIGTLSLAFVRLPTIKLVLAPFRVFNLFAVPFLSRFLSKLLTVDLPRLIVLPRHITFDFLPSGEDLNQAGPAPGGGAPHGPVIDTWASEAPTGLPTQAEPSESFVGELTVTLCEARNLPTWNFSGWSNPYCILTVGERSVESKRNRETSHPSGARDPVWNQDFQFWVEDPLRQKLTVGIRDSSITLNPNIGFIEIPIWQLQDCVPVSMWAPLLQDTPFGVKPATGEIRLLLTYKSYVDKENEVELRNLKVPYIKVFSEDGDSEEELKAPVLSLPELAEVEASDSDGTQLFVFQEEVPGPGGEPMGGSEGSEGEGGSPGGSQGWASAVVGTTVGLSVGAGKWVAEKSAGLWETVVSVVRKREKEEEKKEEKEEKEAEEGKVTEEKGGEEEARGGPVGAEVPKFHTVAAPGLEEGRGGEIGREALSGQLDAERAEKLWVDNRRVVEEVSRKGGNGGVTERVPEEEQDWRELGEEIDGWLQTVGGDRLKFTVMPPSLQNRVASPSSGEDKKGGKTVNGSSDGGEGLKEGSSGGSRESKADEVRSEGRKTVKESSRADGNKQEVGEEREGGQEGKDKDGGHAKSSSYLDNEYVIEVSRTGALNKAIMELVDLFDKQT